MNSRDRLIAELRKTSICASVNEAERMADGIIKTEEETVQDHKEVIAEMEQNRGKLYVTKQEFDSLIKINNKIVEANFIKLKNYIDKRLEKMATVPDVQQKLVVEKKEEPATTSKYTSNDVSVQKIFYCGEK